MLLQASLPSAQEGWVALAESEIPSGTSCSANVDTITCWADYAKARNLTSASIAPLLLTDVLTIYQMIVHVLKLPQSTVPRNGRQHFLVYVLGAERELNRLPLLEELAVLLPNGVNLELRFISPAVQTLCNKAKALPNSFLATCGDYVIDHELSQGARIRVSLDSQHSFFHDVKFHDVHTIPDAVIGLNAGIGSYPEWAATLVRLVACDIPFVFSEYSKQSLRFVTEISIPNWVRNYDSDMKPSHLPNVQMPTLEICLNPFHGIVNRDLAAILIPNMENGYLLVSRAKL
jgi:hypothetical protein